MTNIPNQRRTAWLFIAPAALLLLLVAAWPLFRTFWFSFSDASLSDLGAARWVGVDNYLAFSYGEWNGVLADPQWWQAVWNTLYFSSVSVTFETVLGIIIALMLNSAFPGRPLVRAAVLIPWAIPTIVSAKMWGWIFHDQFGLLNDLLLRLGLIDNPLAWTADPSLVMWSVIIADVWKTTPFMALLVLAAMQMIPKDYYEAARLDGVNPFKVFFRITLPLISPVLIVAVLFRMLDALRIFDLIYVLTPNNVETMSMSVYARQQLVDFQDVGYGSAASTLLFFFIAILTVLFLRLSRFQPGGERHHA
jgi:trehalose/maltose transport system permease protein